MSSGRPGAGRGAARARAPVGRGRGARAGRDLRAAQTDPLGGRRRTRTRRELRTHDRFGNRIDEVEFHPAWHELMRLGVSRGLHASPWREPRPGAHVARAAKFMLASQVEAGVGCPISMTYSVVPALRDAARAGRGVGAALPVARLRPAARSRRRTRRGRCAGWR